MAPPYGAVQIPSNRVTPQPSAPSSRSSSISRGLSGPSRRASSEFRGDLGSPSPFSQTSALAIPRSTTEQAQLFDLPPSEYAAIINQLQNQAHDILQSMAHMRESSERMGARIDTLELEIADLKEGRGDGERGHKAIISINDHPAMKSTVHAMTWALLGIDDKDWDTLAQRRPLENGQAYIQDPQDANVRIWYPRWASPMNEPMNRQFIQAVSTQVYDNEKRTREADTDGSGVHMPDKSFDLEKIKYVAKEYITQLAKRWKEAQSEDGRAKRAQTNAAQTNQSRRTTKTKQRRRIANLLQKTHSFEGACTMVMTDYASSPVDVSEQEISEDSKRRRREQGCAQNGHMVIGRKWRRKKYVKFLRFLDKLLQLEAECKLSSLPEVARALKATDEPEDMTDSERPAKRRKKESGAPGVKELVKEPKKPRRQAKTTFQAHKSKANTRAPVAKKGMPVYHGMVSQTWLAEYQAEGHTLELQDDPAWWRSWNPEARNFDPGDLKLLDELTDSDNEVRDGSIPLAAASEVTQMIGV
ncbi:hypothetical protein B0H21DRAFT_840125 [Amylocystis lapponica]|nr:hypothetical protein B0H21DRAFT_840125 [Amylocystis lapponica]